MILKETKNYVIKYLPDGSKIGWMKTRTEKFYLGTDGILSVVPIESNQSVFGGRFHKGCLDSVPKEFSNRIYKHEKELRKMYSVLCNRD